MDEIEEYESSQSQEAQMGGRGQLSPHGDSIEIDEFPSLSQNEPEYVSPIEVKDLEIEEFSNSPYQSHSSSDESEPVSSVQVENIEIDEFPNSPDQDQSISREESDVTIDEFPDFGSPPKKILKSAKSSRPGSVKPSVELPTLARSSDSDTLSGRKRKHRYKEGGLADQMRKSQRTLATNVLLWQQSVQRDAPSATVSTETLKFEILEVKKERGVVKTFCKGAINESKKHPAEMSNPFFGDCLVILDRKWSEKRNLDMLAPGKHLVVHPPYQHFQSPQLFSQPVILCPSFVHIQAE